MQRSVTKKGEFMDIDEIRARGIDFSVVVSDNNAWPVNLAKAIKHIQVNELLCIKECINSPQCGMVVTNLTLLMQDKRHEQPVRFDLYSFGDSLVVHCVPK